MSGADDRGPTESKLITWASPTVYAEVARSGRYRTGLEMLRAMAAGELPVPPIAKLLDYWPVAFDEGSAVFACRPQACHYNPAGVVHGGLAATLLDTALACAIHTKLPIATVSTTIELKVNYIRPMTAATGEVRCAGELVHLGKRIATAAGRLLDAEGRLLAHATTTCMVVEA